jgi:hypothetical protein
MDVEVGDVVLFAKYSGTETNMTARSCDHARERYPRDSLRNIRNQGEYYGKTISFGDEARRYLKNGVDAVANAVATTWVLRDATLPWIANMVPPPSLTTA